MHGIARGRHLAVGAIDHESRQQSCRLSAVEDGRDDDPDRRLLGEGMDRPDRDRAETGFETGQNLRQRLGAMDQREIPARPEQAPGRAQPGRERPSATWAALRLGTGEARLPPGG